MNNLELFSSANSESLAFEQHPARDLDLEQRQLYLNGLAFMMNIDSEIHHSEKEYLGILIYSFNLPTEAIDQFIHFAKNPEKRTLQEIGKAFSGNDIRFTYLIDTLMLMHRDDLLHDNECSLFEQYSLQMKITDHQKKHLKLLAKALLQQNQSEVDASFYSEAAIPPASYSYLIRYFNLQENYLKKMNLELAKKIYQFTPGVVSWCYNSGFSKKHIASNNITIQQFALFLQSELDAEKFHVHENIVFDNTGVKIFKLDKSIRFSPASRVIHYPESEKLNLVQGFSPHGAQAFTEFLSRVSGIKIEIPKLSQSYESAYVNDSPSISINNLIKCGNNYSRISLYNNDRYYASMMDPFLIFDQIYPDITLRVAFD